MISAVAAHAGATYVDLRPTFRGPDGTSDPTPLLTDDGEHPNQAGHDAITAAITPPLQQATSETAR